MKKYIPKSKARIKKTTEGFIVKTTGKNYSGDYIETYNKKYFAGTDTNNLTIELLKSEETSNNIGQSLDSDKYTILQNATYQKLKKYDVIPGSKSIPSEEDYNRGYFLRYYLIRVNSNYYKEINIKTYNKYSSKKKIDEALYDLDMLKWALVGDVMSINFNMLKIQERKHPGITRIFPIYNEFERIENYDIKGRNYPDLTEIPSQLPPSYDLPKVANRTCQSCFYNKNNKCKKWNADIKSNYWCKSFIKMGVKENFDDPLYALGLGDMEDFQKAKDKEGY